jgi:snapalysin
MLHRTVARTLIGASTIALSATLIPAAHAAPAPAAVVTLHYDASQAAEFKSAVAAGVASWNASVRNVHIVAASAGTRAEIQVVAFDGWPQSNLGPVRPGGRVTVWFGREAVNEGYNTTRIAAHELGHSLGLPDAKPGPCSSLMSGSTGGVSCTNATPNASEKAGVESNYANGVTAQRPLGGVLVDAP